ncbi:hypothetical protein DSO57_1038575 [Entomophthora muscae]|uniref:Uncharacterized protein n=1 Tax=Entomophthora muscae TaxID=34485 RepID=A0ACC2UIP2_9FUNG|nr:hypothetical protein DSO57_1038575 [Entomophthora muscae]
MAFYNKCQHGHFYILTFEFSLLHSNSRFCHCCTPIEEDIKNPPIVPTVLNLGNSLCLVAYPMGTPDLEQVMAVALGIAREGTIPCLQLQFS